LAFDASFSIFFLDFFFCNAFLDFAFSNFFLDFSFFSAFFDFSFPNFFLDFSFFKFFLLLVCAMMGADAAFAIPGRADACRCIPPGLTDAAFAIPGLADSCLT